MALFGKKKSDADVPAAAPAANPQDTANQNASGAPETFDFDSISRDLDVQNGASSFDSLLATPVNNPPAASPTTPTAIPATGISEDDPLGLATPAAPISSAYPAAMPTPPASGAPIATALPPAKPRKSLPLIPLLGALGLVAVVGAGFMLMRSSGSSDSDSDTNVPTAPSRPVTNAAAPPASGNAATVSNAVVPAGNAAAGTPPAPGVRSASPGIAPVGAPPSKGPDVVIQVPGTAKGPSATQGLDPGLASRLKALWRAGADAKHRQDIEGARKAWQEALRLRPNHPGFQDALNKLPR